MRGKQKLWTFIVGFEGGTYISQYPDMSLLEAIKSFNSSDPSGQGAVPIDPELVATTGLEGVFYCSGLTDRDEYIAANIVATEIYS